MSARSVGDFTLALDKFAKKAPDKAHTVVSKVCISLLRNVVLQTPVGNPSLWQSPPPAGYVGGRLRSNWNTGFGAVNRDEHGPDKSGRGSIGRGTLALLQRPAEKDVYITNSLPYAIPVEYGHSTQAPAGMLRVTISQFNGLVTDVAKKESK